MVLTVTSLPAKSVHLIGKQKKDVASAILISSCPMFLMGLSMLFQCEAEEYMPVVFALLQDGWRLTDPLLIIG
ncbi:hypothetical protein L2E82_16217 [Cichorium intybus]|uniref:Uncharacterized protein n=1 Tax=Cichorium intybus TaxID=13427 RepID=A0ACB9F644_CICIN|nr:hypothetical protein L2E82_16217 [Cichorium intybus]